MEVVVVGDGDGSAGNGKEGGGDDANTESTKVSGEMITYIIIIGVEYVLIVVSRKHSSHDHDGGSVHQAMAMMDGNYDGVSLIKQ